MIEVESFACLEQLRALGPELDQLVQASARKSPFQTAAFLENVVRNDEVFQSAAPPTPLFLAARERGRLVGFCALRAVQQRTAGLPWTKLEWLLTLEVNRPHVVVHADDRAAVAAALWRHLATRERWSMIELQQQDDGSEVFPPAAGALPRSARLRTLASREGNVLPLVDDRGEPRFADLEAYLAALSRKQRSNVKRSTIALLRRPGLALLSSSRPAAARLLFDLYLDVEQRSWKARGDAAIQRSAARVAYYRGLLDEAQPMRLQVDVLLDDGVPIAGHITGAYAGSTYFLQTVYDEALVELSPGTLLLLWSVKDAIERGAARFDMLPDFSYYKSRWLADVVPTRTVQVFRAGSVPWLKALLGDARRALRAPGAARAAQPETARANASKLEADRRRAEVAAPPPDRALAARTLRALAALSVQPIPAAELAWALPFDTAETSGPRAGQEPRARDCARPRAGDGARRGRRGSAGDDPRTQAPAAE